MAKQKKEETVVKNKGKNEKKEIKKEIKKNAVIENKKTKIEKPKILEKPNNDELICCRSCVAGELFYKSPKTGMMYIWGDIGAEEYLEFGELVTMNAKRSRLLTEPWIMIEDERVIKFLGLKKLYSKIGNLDDIKNFFKLPLDEMKMKIQNYPKGIQKLFAEKSREMIQSEELYDTRIIKMLEDKLQIELIKTDLED